MVETVVISREGMNISISVHNKDTARFVKQIKTPGQLLYAAAETGRVIPFGSFSGRDHVRTLGASAPFINPKYNPDSVLSIRELNARQETSRESARNYVLEKLRAAGIEVVTDKDAFDAALQPGGKIYLNPDIFTAETAAHEYTHIWDHYIRMTDRELWEKGKAVFSRTGLWKEVAEDPEYRDIAASDDLVMSECHARIVASAAADRRGKNPLRARAFQGDQRRQCYLRGGR